jgi:hypothetical protein
MSLTSLGPRMARMIAQERTTRPHSIGPRTIGGGVISDLSRWFGVVGKPSGRKDLLGVIIGHRSGLEHHGLAAGKRGADPNPCPHANQRAAVCMLGV